VPTLNQVIAVDRSRNGSLLHSAGHKLEESHLSTCVLHSDSLHAESHHTLVSSNTKHQGKEVRKQLTSGFNLRSEQTESGFSSCFPPRANRYVLEVSLTPLGSIRPLYIVQMGVEDLLGESELLAGRQLRTDGLERLEQTRVRRGDGTLQEATNTTVPS
jgi:hypothetical protein